MSKMNKAEFTNFMTELSHSKSQDSKLHKKNSKHNAKPVTKAEAEKALNWVLEAFIEAIKHNRHVSITGFGAFGIHSRKACNGRNPKTGEAMIIPAYKHPVFRAGSKMKEACN